MYMAAVPAMAAKHSVASTTTTTVSLGNDVAWPQCGKSLPSGQAFGIVGVNGGKANNFNSCYATQLAWAQKSSGKVAAQPPVQLYLNTGNPGDVLAQYNVQDWPTTSDPAIDPYGQCSGTWTNDKPCSWQYGYERAQADVAFVGAGSYKYWLDVETVNSWSSDLSKNQAVLEGMTFYLQHQGSTVGLYSTAYQWNQLIGTPAAGSSLNGLDNWYPGASSQKNAVSYCSKTPFTPGSKITLTQYVSRNLDYDYSCI